MADIRVQKLLYHLTDINNLEFIFKEGLKSRSALQGFSDVADPKIISSRKALQLEDFVPFHFFAGTPFDGRVHVSNPDKTFVLITIQRSYAKAQNWKIIPRHPLSGSDITLLDYEKGMDTIDWETMSRRKYDDENCKCICMAECLSPATVFASEFHCIYVPDDDAEAEVKYLKEKYGLKMFVTLKPEMFPGAR